MTHVTTTTKRQTDDEETEDIPPPDGGWGWWVVFASFMIHIATDGVTYSFGVFYTEFLNYFKSGKGETAWILSLLVGVTYISGPIVGAFVNRYGCRAVTIAGSILAGSSLIVSVFAPNIFTLYVTIGLGTGFGFGLIYLPAIICVTIYFEKYRSLATGIAVCGSGFGTFLFAPLIELMASSWGWKTAMVVTGLLIYTCVLFGIMFRPVEETTKRKEVAVNGNGKATIELQETFVFNVDDLQIKSEDSALQRPRSMVYFANVPPKGPKSYESIPNGSLTRSNRLAVSQPALVVDSTFHFGSQSINRRSKLLKRKDIFYQGSLCNIPQYRSRNSLSKKSCEELQLVVPNRAIESNKKHSSNCLCSEDTSETIAGILNVDLFRDLIFVLFAISNFLTSIGFNIPYVYIKAQAESLGIDNIRASYLIAIIGIANTVARIVLGYVADKPWVNRLLIYNTCLTVNGIATFFSAFCYDFFTLAVYAIIYGMTIGAYVGLTSVILVDLLGLDKLTNAFGLLLLFQGIASLIGSPIAGFLYDSTGSYNPGFMMAGIAIALSGLMLYTIPSVRRCLKSNEKPGNVSNVL